MNTKAFLALLLLFCILLPAFGQTQPAVPQPPPPPQKPADDKDDVVRITTNLVQVDVVVTKDGKIVPNLTAADFEIFEDGRRQTITSFTYISNVGATPAGPVAKDATPVPLGPIKRDVPRRTMALIVDDLGLSAEGLARTAQQLKKFIAEQLQPNDLVAVIRTGGEMGALQQFTNNKFLLNRAVDKLRWNACSRIGISVFRAAESDPSIFRPMSVPVPDPCGGYSLSKTMKALQFVVDALGELPGRKAMVVFSDSLPRQDQEVSVQGAQANTIMPFATENSILFYNLAEKAIRASVVIYSVDTQGLATTGITAADSINGPQINNLHASRSALLLDRREGGALLARQTGGFQVRNSNSFGLDRIAEDQSGYYLLGYRPTTETFNRRFHNIKANVKGAGLSLRTRKGFYGFTEEEANRVRNSNRARMNVALASPFGLQDVEVDMAAFFTNSPERGSVVRSFLYLKATDLTFVQANDRYEASVDVQGVIFGDNGSVVEQAGYVTKLSFPQAVYEQSLRDGVQFRLDIPVKRSGLFQVRVAARDATSSRIGSAGQFVDVPDLKNKKLAMSGIILRGSKEVSAEGERSAEGMTNPAVRRFSRQSDLYFGSVIYNALRDRASGLPNVTMQARLFREGKSIFSSPEMTVTSANQPDLARLLCNGTVRLTPDLEPGNYFLQLVTVDKLAKKPLPVVQWVDFELVK